MFIMKIKFKKWNCIAKGMYYANREKALQLIDENNNEVIAMATVSFPDEFLGDDEIFVKDYSENEGMTEALIEANIIYKTPIETAASGHATIVAYELTEEGLKLWDNR